MPPLLLRRFRRRRLFAKDVAIAVGEIGGQKTHPLVSRKFRQDHGRVLVFVLGAGEITATSRYSPSTSAEISSCDVCGSTLVTNAEFTERSPGGRFITNCSGERSSRHLSKIR